MHPPFDSIAIGPILLKIYSIIITLSIILAYYLVRRRARLYGIDQKFVDDLLPIIIIFGIFGARVYHVLDKWSYYSQRPTEIFMIWHGGIGIFGGLIAGFLVLWIFARRRNVDVLRFLDLASPPLLLAQALGRWGNFFNQEAFGRPTSSRIFVAIDVAHQPIQWLGFSHFQPLFLYEFFLGLFGSVYPFLFCSQTKDEARISIRSLLHLVWAWTTADRTVSV